MFDQVGTSQSFWNNEEDYLEKKCSLILVLLTGVALKDIIYSDL